MGEQAADFFVSYHDNDRGWAEWIAWQLEEGGYTIIIPVWDFRPGGNLVANMQRATVEAKRTIAVLSPDYLASPFAQAEWSSVFSGDPTGNEGLLVPIRIKECELTGLLSHVVYIDLVNLDQDLAKRALLSGVNRGRAKPTVAPQFPGESGLLSKILMKRGRAKPTIVPRFPGSGTFSSGRDLPSRFLHAPFAYFKAEEMPWSILDETYVEDVDFDRHVIEKLEQSLVLLVPWGSGKTALRRRLEHYLHQIRQGTFEETLTVSTRINAPMVVNLDSFDYRLLQRLPDISLQQFEKSLLGAVANAVYGFFVAYPDRFMAADSAQRMWWWAFFTTYLTQGETLQYRLLSNPAYKILYQDWQEGEPYQSPFHPDTNIEIILITVSERMTWFALDSLFILVDGVDGYPETRDLTNLQALVAPLLNTLPLFSTERVIWKFFLPVFLGETVRASTGYKTGRLNIISIRWNEDRLKELLRLRLYWATEGKITQLAQMFDMQVAQELDIDHKLAKMALRHKALGPPRSLLKLGEQLFEFLTEDKAVLALDDWHNFQYRVRSQLTVYPVSFESVDQDLTEQKPSASGIPADLHRRVRNTLSICDSFATDRGLNGLFVDERLISWRNRLPEASNPSDRAQAVIGFLFDKYDYTHGNGLISLLKVLKELYHVDNELHQTLKDLIDDLGQIL